MNPSEIVSFPWGVAGLMLAGDEKDIRAKQTIRTVYDPCCGSGGMRFVWIGGR